MFDQCEIAKFRETSDPWRGAPLKLEQSECDPSEVVPFFEKVAETENWRPGDHLSAHIARSIYLGVWHRGELAGAIQLVTADDKGHLPAHLVWPELPRLEAQSGVRYYLGGSWM